MKTHVQKWGNSLAVRIPKHLVKEAGLEYNSSVELKVEEGKLVIRRSDEPLTLASLLEQVTPENIHTAVETGDAQGDEIW